MQRICSSTSTSGRRSPRLSPRGVKSPVLQSRDGKIVPLPPRRAQLSQPLRQSRKCRSPFAQHLLHRLSRPCGKQERRAIAKGIATSQDIVIAAGAIVPMWLLAEGIAWVASAA